MITKSMVRAANHSRRNASVFRNFDVIFCILSCTMMVADTLTPQIGINYGRVADNLPSPAQVITLIQNLKINAVKIYDANSQVLTALANTGLQVSVMVPNEQISGIATSQTNSDIWVQQNILPYYPSTQITTLAVGNEILSDTSIKSVWTQLVPAMENIHASLVKNNISKIQVTTTVASDALGSSFPPSNGTFRDDIAASVMKPLLEFLSRTNSVYFANIYPYFAWAGNSQKISLDYALLGSSSVVVTDGSRQYSSLIDAMVDATIVAMRGVGYGDVGLVISETGWPTQGGTGANVKNAAMYNRRVVRWALASPAVGTPLRPNAAIPTFIFALFNEDQKPGPATERNWGVLYPDGSRVYAIDFTGQLHDDQYGTPSAQNISSSSSSSSSSAAPAATDNSSSSAATVGMNSSSSATTGVGMNSSTSSTTVGMNSSSSATTGVSMNSSSSATTVGMNSSSAAAAAAVLHVNSSAALAAVDVDQKHWCVVDSAAGIDKQQLQEALDYVCKSGNGDCHTIQAGESCYDPNTLSAHASYAFNSYWQQWKNSGGSCDFDGAAKLTDTDPSSGSCTYPYLRSASKIKH